MCVLEGDWNPRNNPLKADISAWCPHITHHFHQSNSSNLMISSLSSPAVSSGLANCRDFLGRISCLPLHTYPLGFSLPWAPKGWPLWDASNGKSCNLASGWVWPVAISGKSYKCREVERLENEFPWLPPLSLQGNVGLCCFPLPKSTVPVQWPSSVARWLSGIWELFHSFWGCHLFPAQSLTGMSPNHCLWAPISPVTIQPIL